METLSKTPVTETTREKVLGPPPAPSGVVSDSLSLPSYKEYPAHRPLVRAPVHHTPHRRTHQSCYPSKPRTAFPETSSDAILSALRNLQEKIRRLELERGHTELSLHTMGKEATHAHLQSDKVAQRQSDRTDTERERSGPSSCNQVLVTHLAAAESRCAKLEQQLDHTRRMLRNAKADRSSLLKQQVFMETAKSGNQQANVVCERSQLVKLERLEQEYLRLTHTQNNAEMKMRQLEMRLQEEEHQRKLVQEKANQLQAGLEANRILLQSVSPRPSHRPSKEKRASSKRPSLQQSPHTQPHYRLNLRDVPFIAGTVVLSHTVQDQPKSVSCSHSVRANVQSVLSLLKQHQPHLCNRRVLSNNANHRETGRRRQSDASSSSSSSSASGEELSELLQALQEELRLMSLEQDELMRRLEASVSERERNDLQREQERLLMKMERKGEQIRTLYKHKTQIREMRKEASCRPKSGDEETLTVFSRGRSAGPVKVKPGERSKRNLRLLRDMKALQTSLRT